MRRVAWFLVGFWAMVIWGCSSARAETVASIPFSPYEATVSGAHCDWKTGLNSTVYSSGESASAAMVAAWGVPAPYSDTGPWVLNANAPTCSTGTGCASASPTDAIPTCSPTWVSGATSGNVRRWVKNTTSNVYVIIGGSYFFYGVYVAGTATCPNGGTPNGGSPNMCTGGSNTCPTGGYTLDPGGATCTRSGATVSCPAGPDTLFIQQAMTQQQFVGLPSSISGGCATPISPSGAGLCSYALRPTGFTGGVAYLARQFDGSACSSPATPSLPITGAPAPTTPASSPDSDCVRSGGFPGTVNGVPTCNHSGVGENGINFGGQTTSTTHNPDGTTTTTTQTPVTTCVNGVCTTTTTTTIVNPGGTTTTTTTQPGSGGTCNPATQVCGSGAGGQSDWSGSCSAGFICGGDAVQCAIAQDQYQRHCELFLQSGPQTSTDALNYFTNLHNSAVTGPTKTSVTLDSLDSTPFLGSSSCIADLVIPISLPGHVGGVTIPMSQYCSALSVLGNILVSLTALACMFIVARGVSYNS